jgi:hypothetical protein
MKLVWDSFYCALDYKILTLHTGTVRLTYKLSIINKYTKTYAYKKHRLTRKREFECGPYKVKPQSYRALIINHLRDSIANIGFWIVSENVVRSPRRSFVEIRLLNPRMDFNG